MKVWASSNYKISIVRLLLQQTLSEYNPLEASQSIPPVALYNTMGNAFPKSIEPTLGRGTGDCVHKRSTMHRFSSIFRSQIRYAIGIEYEYYYVLFVIESARTLVYCAE